MADIRADPLTVACIRNTTRPRTGRRCLISSTTRPRRPVTEGVGVGYIVIQTREGWYFSYAEFDRSIGRGVARTRIGIENDAIIEFVSSSRDKLRACCMEGEYSEYGSWNWDRPRINAVPNRAVADLERNLEQVRVQITEANREKQVLERNLEQARIQVTEADREKQVLERNLEQARVQVTEANTEKQDLERRLAERDATITQLREEITALRTRVQVPPEGGRRGTKYGYLDRNTVDIDEMNALFIICDYVTTNPDLGPTVIARWLDTNHPNLPKRGRTSWNNEWGREVIKTAKSSRCQEIAALR